MKVKIRNGTRNIIIGFFAILIIIFLSTSNSHAATGNVTFYLNGGTIPGFSNIDVRTLDVGVPFVIPSNPVKPGYDFMGWMQHGAGGIGPQGSLKNTQDPIYGGNGSFGTDAVSKPVTELYNTGFSQTCATGLVITKPSDCEIPLLEERPGTNTIARIRITGNAREYNDPGRLVVTYNGTNRNWLPNTMYRCVAYVKIPNGYSLAQHWFKADVVGTTYSINKPYGSNYDISGNGEYQYIEWLWYSGSGMNWIYAPAFVFYKNNLSLPDPSPSNPIDFDFGYLSYSIADGSLGTSLQKDFKGQNTYTSNGGWDGLTAIYEPSTYTITYDANGGSTPPASQSYRYKPANNILLASTNPIKAGCTFLGWSKSKNATTPDYLSNSNWSCVVIGNTTLYAVWKFSGCKITSPKTLILGSNGNCSFKISSIMTSGSVQITTPSSITLKQPKKPDLIGTLTISDTTLTSLKQSTSCTIKVNGLTAGSWSSQFNIAYKYIP